MTHPVHVEIPDEIYEPIEQEAMLRGQTLEQVVLDRLRRANREEPVEEDLTEEERAEAMARLLRYAGAVSVPDPTNAVNEAIDRDLAAEYEATHDEVD